MAVRQIGSTQVKIERFGKARTIAAAASAAPRSPLRRRNPRMDERPAMGSLTPQELERDTVRALRWTEEGLFVLDQRKLPEHIKYRLCRTLPDVASAIASMQVRGAPAIGIAAAYGIVLAVRHRLAKTPANWKASIAADLERLAAARPTAINLFWAIERMRAVIEAAGNDPLPQLEALAMAIHEDDIASNRTMGSLGAELVAGSDAVLTHCNTGSLATGGYGTALGVIRSAHQRGLRHVYATETRPWLQGARLTLWELLQEGIPATLIADSAAALLMRLGRVDWVIVGADRIAANGDTANKIGTYALAVAARYHGVRTMVVAPTSTIDWDSLSGDAIPIEERNPAELLPAYYTSSGGAVDAWNPVFDVTPAELIDAIVTEKGVVERPGIAAMAKLHTIIH